MNEGAIGRLWSVPWVRGATAPRSTILPPPGPSGQLPAPGRVVCSVEEYLQALLGRGTGAAIQDMNVIGDTAPTLIDELRDPWPAEAC